MSKNITISPVIASKRPNPCCLSGNEKAIDIGTLLLRAKKKDEEAENKLLEYFKEYIGKTAARTFGKSRKWLSYEELRSEGMYGLAKAILRFDPEHHHSPEYYVKGCIKNAMRDYVRGESYVHHPLSSLLTDKDNYGLTLEKLKLDPSAEDLNSYGSSPDIRDDVKNLRLFLKSDQVQKILTEREKGIMEFDIWGTNIKSNKEIANILNMNVDNFLMAKSRILKKLRAAAQTMSV